MRLFELRNLQDIVLFLFPALVFVLLFGLGLAFSHIKRKDSEERETRIIEEYIDEIRGRNAPFPLMLHLVIIGTVIWGVLYIVLTGVWGVRI